MMKIYTRCFNQDGHLKVNPFQTMIDHYQELFDEEMKGLNMEVFQKGVQAMIHQQIGETLTIYEATMEGKLEAGKHMLSEEEYLSLKEGKRECEEVLDLFVEVLNKDMGETEVTIDSPKRLKYEYLKQTYLELSKKNRSGETSDSDKKMLDAYFKNLQVENKKGGIKGLPQKNITIEEFEAIKDTFSGSDF